MKKYLFSFCGLQYVFTVALLILGSQGSSAVDSNPDYGWRVVVSNITAKSIDTLSMLDESRWWAGMNTHLAFTENGGAKWDAIYESPALNINALNVKVSNPIREIQFLDENRGWLLSTNLMTTDDGGRSWKDVHFSSHTESTVRVPRSFYFIDANRGWVAGNVLEGGDEKSSAVLWETMDAGKHWREVRCLECDENEVFWDLAATKNEGLFILGNVIHRRKQASSHFEEMKINLSDASSQLMRVGIADPRTIWAETADGSYCFVSHNQGKSWATVKLDKESDRIVFVDDRRAYLASKGDVFFSEDGGRNWRLDLQGDYEQLHLDGRRRLIAAIGQGIAIKELN